MALFLRIEIFYLTPEIPPCLIAIIDCREQFHLIHDLVHRTFYILGEVTVFLLAPHCIKLRGQRHHQRLYLWMVTDGVSHFLNQRFHLGSGPSNQLIPGGRLLLVGVEHLLLENIVGQLGFDLTDAILREIRLTRFCRPRHHVDVGIVTLIVEGGIPTEVTGRYVHRLCDFVAVCAEQIVPLLCMVVSQALGIFTLERDNVCPDVAGVLVQFLHGGAQIHIVLVTEETVGAGTLSHVFHVPGRQQLYAVAGTDVFQIAASAAALDVGALDDQSCH